MRVETLGDGEPEIALIGGIHGDEPCGPAAIDSLLESDLEVARPVKLIVANERALEMGVRYVETDLNRAFPGSPDAGTHEERLAHRLLREIRGCSVMSMHSTQSYAAPFALVDEVDGFNRAIFPHLSIEAVVETASYSAGRLASYPQVIELECGLQYSAGAAANATRIAREYLVATGALPGGEARTPYGPIPVFKLIQHVPKAIADECEVHVPNFERVAEGEHFASADGEPLYAESPFYPILMSPYGYEDVFGYTGKLVGRLDVGDRHEQPTEQA